MSHSKVCACKDCKVLNIKREEKLNAPRQCTYPYAEVHELNALLPAAHFYTFINQQGNRVFQSYCKSCYSKHTVRQRQIKKRRAVDAVQVDKSCAICGTTKNLEIDHSHTCMHTRGWLCHTHNIGLGSFQDSVELLTKAIAYLEKHAAECSIHPDNVNS